MFCVHCAPCIGLLLCAAVLPWWIDVGSAEETAAKAPVVDSSQAVVERALTKAVKLQFVEKPLTGVVSELQQQLGVPVHLDRKALANVGLAVEETKATFAVDGISARDALSLLLRPLDLTWTLVDEVLLITTPEEAQNILLTRVYDVADLVVGDRTDESPMGECDFDALIDVITSCIDPTTWDDVGGPGSICPFQAAGIKSLVFSQTPEVHEAVAVLLADLRSVRHDSPSPEDGAKPTGKEHHLATSPKLTHSQVRLSPAEKAIKQALSKRIDADLQEKPLAEVIGWLKATASVPIVVDQKALADVSIDAAHAPLTCKASGVTLRSALNLMLRELNLTWTIRDEVLLITTPEEADNCLLTRVYDVADLPSFRDTQAHPVPDFDSLVELIVSTIKPPSWDSLGGPGSVHAFRARGIQAIVVSQTWQTHEEIEGLLAQLRSTRSEAAFQHDLAILPEAPAPVNRCRRDSPRVFGDPAPPKPAPLPKDPKRDAAVKAVNDLAIDLYERLPAADKGNIFFSPCSISTSLAMVYAGARGETGAEMARCLHYDLPPAEIHAGFAALLGTLPSGEKTGCEFRLANRLWAQRDHKFLDEFVQMLQQDYRTELAQVDFSREEDARRAINAWIQQKTGGKISQLIGPGELNQGDPTRLVLTSAIFFKGRWATPFSAEATKMRPFDGQGERSEVSMMHGVRRCAYAAVDDVQVLELPYTGGTVSMVILLPKKDRGALERLETGLTNDRLTSWLAALRQQEVAVSLPKFKLESRCRLEDVLESMGMSTAFKRGKADLSGMDGTELLYLQSVIHQGCIEVDEQGVEATATTAAVAGLGGLDAQPPRLPVFLADHPFVFLLRDTRSGAILFFGRLMQPPAAKAIRNSGQGTGMF